MYKCTGLQVLSDGGVEVCGDRGMQLGLPAPLSHCSALSDPNVKQRKTCGRPLASGAERPGSVECTKREEKQMASPARYRSICARKRAGSEGHALSSMRVTK